MSANGGQLQKLTSFSSIDPALSPDGKKLYFLIGLTYR